MSHCFSILYYTSKLNFEDISRECIFYFLLLKHSLQQVVLQPEEELLSNPAKELNSEGAAVRPKKTFGKMKVQGTTLFF